MGLQLPHWWVYPTECGNGHRWGPGRVLVSWQPCECSPARAVQPRGAGHRVIACRAPGREQAAYEPPHDPATAGLPACAAAQNIGASASRRPGLAPANGLCSPAAVLAAPLSVPGAQAGMIMLAADPDDAQNPAAGTVPPAARLLITVRRLAIVGIPL
jgi:hypothetical protein